MASAHYPDVNPNPDFARLEEEILHFWKENRTFERSVEQRQGGNGNDYVFYDGPPFANGLPHYGHLLTGYVKDAIARYHTMKGKRVERRFGWDCHGLPAEMGSEKELNITGRAAIIEYGIGKFNDYCRNNVMRYVADWEYYVGRQGRWVDFKNDYKTMDKNFMESVIWAFSELYKKDLVFEAFRVMPYSWAAETPLSNFETRMDNATREREDKAAYVKFKLKDKPQGAPEAENYYIIAWTTTPWTLPSNLALAVSKNLTYEFIKKDEECFILAQGTHLKLMREIGTPTPDDKNMYETTPSGEVTGDKLIGLTYEPLFPYFAKRIEGSWEDSPWDSQWEGSPKAFTVIDGGEAVTEGEGTGVIHMAPGFGEIDQKVCAENGIEVMVPVDGQGKFTDEIFDLMLETERLYLRAFTEADYPLYRALQSDPKVAATTSDGVLPEEKIRAEFDRILADQRQRGYSQWAAFRKQDGTFIGRAGFDQRVEYKKHNTSGVADAELRYALLSEHWGSGYATELANALLDWAVPHLPEHYIIAGCNPGYPSARKLLAKLGFASHHEVDFHGQPVLYHTLDITARKVAATLPPHLKLKNLIVVPDTRLNAGDIHVSDEDRAQHIDVKDVQKYGLANMRIVRWLKAHGKLVKDEPYKHNYPHCWRTDTPIIYRAMSSWYVAVTKFRDRAVELNKQINWIPGHVRDGQMGHMLATAPDWSISRNRFWGTPIPIWRAPSGKMIVPGSIAEIEQLSGQKVADLHRPFIDEITFERDGETYTRVEDVFDCWFESGSMPYAQLHYPFENKQLFEENFPADFITEYVGQTRGWFNTLIMLSTALFDKPPFKNCICHGVVLDEETGLKYSKRLKNYKDPKEVMNGYGADALRWMMMDSPVMRGADIGVDPEGKFIRDVVRLNIKPLWSAYNFFTLYANADGVKANEITASENRLDRYILAKAKAAVLAVETSMDAYDTTGATNAITGFFDVLNNWYIRRSRARFWAEDVTADKQAAYDTLYTVITLLCRAAAPLLPFTAEAIFRGLGAGESVHLTDFPKVEKIADERALIADMDKVRDACTAMGSIRSAENIRNRQPLASATLYGAGADRLKPFAELMEDELNVKEIRFANTLEGVAEFSLSVDFKVAGKRLGPKMKAVGAAAKAGDWRRDGDQIIVGGEPMEAGEYNLNLKSLVSKGAQALPSNDAIVVLDLTITPELEAEGRARDLVRMIQQARKDAGLNVSDRILLTLDLPLEMRDALQFKKSIVRETLSKLILGDPSKSMYNSYVEYESLKIGIGLDKIKEISVAEPKKPKQAKAKEQRYKRRTVAVRSSTRINKDSKTGRILKRKKTSRKVKSKNA